MNNPQPVSIPLENRFIRYVLYSLLLCLALPFITACDYGQNKNKEKKTNLAPPSFAEENVITKKQIQEIATPANIEDGITIDKVAINNQNDQPTNKIIASGYKTNILFDNQKLNVNERLLRIENAVQKISDKLVRIDPAIIRLTEIDSDLSLLTNQLEILISQSDQNSFESQRSAPPFLNVELKEQQKQEPIIEVKAPAEDLNEILPAAGNTALAIDNIRMSDHSDRTRIVFDSHEEIDFQRSLKTPNLVKVNVNKEANFSDIAINKYSAVIKKVTVDEQTNSFLFTLGKDVTDISGDYITPSAQSPYHRYYVDLMY